VPARRPSPRPRAAPARAPARPSPQLAGLRENVESTCNELEDRSLQLQRLMAVYSSSNRAVQTLAESKTGAPRGWAAVGLRGAPC
jgi:hypothetical protein